MGIDDEVLDRLMAGYEKPEDLLGEQGLFKQLQKRLLERALGVVSRKLCKRARKPIKPGHQPEPRVAKR